MAQALLDTNVLVYAAFRRSPLYGPAAELVARGLRQRGLYCIAPQNLIEFASAVTRRRRGEPTLPSEELTRMCGLLYRSRTLAKIYPRRATVIRAIREGAALGICGAAWYDLFLAVTMSEAGVSTVITENVADFRRFPFLTVRSIQEAV